MRWIATLCLFTSLVACAVEPSAPPDDPVADPAAGPAPVTEALAAARSPLEQRFDALLRANAGAGCEVEPGSQICVVTTEADPARVLRIGDPISSPAGLRQCAGSSCTLIAVPLPTQLSCGGFALCLPLTTGCLPQHHFECVPAEHPTPGHHLTCKCVQN